MLPKERPDKGYMIHFIASGLFRPSLDKIKHSVLHLDQLVTKKKCNEMYFNLRLE